MKISVIMASYNYAQYLEEAINSVINQAYENWELIVVDDGSTDNSVEIIKSYCVKDSRIKLVQHVGAKNKGLKETILLGLELVTGDWIAFLESDDFFSPDNFSKKLEIIEKYPNINLIFNRVKLLEEKGYSNKRLIKGFTKKQKRLSNMIFPRDMFYDFYINNMITTFSCVMVEKDVLKNTNLNTPVDCFLDWWLWINLAYGNNFYYVDEELTTWRLHAESYVKKGKKPIIEAVQAKAYKSIYEKKDKSLKLLSFIILSDIKLFFYRCYRFLNKLFSS